MSLRISTTQKPVIVTANPAPLPSVAQDTQVLTNVNNTNIWTYPQYYFQGKNFIPSTTLDVSSFPQYSVSALGKYGGSALSNRGFIYCFPDNSNNVMIINTYTNTVDTTTISNINNTTYPVLGSTQYLFTGGVTVGNNIYAVPQRARAIMNINTVNNSVSFIDISSLCDVSDNWYGAVLGTNGNVYGMNHVNTSILRFDPSTNIASKIPITGLSGSAPYYAGGVLAPNGNIYGIPFRATSIVVVDTSNNTAVANIPGLTGIVGSDKYIGGVLGQNGKIYCIPFSSNDVLVIDPSNNTTSTFSAGITGTNKYCGGVLGLDGTIYAVPHRANSVLIINPDNNTANVTDISGIYTVDDRWQGGVLAPNGKIYLNMARSPNIGIIKTRLPTQEPWMMAPEFNKL